MIIWKLNENSISNANLNKTKVGRHDCHFIFIKFDSTFFLFRSCGNYCQMMPFCLCQSSIVCVIHIVVFCLFLKSNVSCIMQAFTLLLAMLQTDVVVEIRKTSFCPKPVVLQLSRTSARFSILFFLYIGAICIHRTCLTWAHTK